MKKHKPITEQDFDEIKTYTNEGLSLSAIHKLTGNSIGTISYIRSSSTYADYRDKVRKDYYKHFPNKAYRKLDQKDFDEIKAYQKKGIGTMLIRKLTKRSQSTITLIKRVNTLEEYRELVKQNELKKPSYLKKMGLIEPYEVVSPEPDTVIVSDYEVSDEELEKLVKQLNFKNDSENKTELDVALNQLDADFEKLKESITLVVLASIDSKIAEEQKAKEEIIKQREQEIEELKVELAASKTVVEAAKSSNLMTSLKNALMGNQLKP